MTIIPEGFGQITHRFTGLNCPTGAVVTFGINLDGVADPGDIPEAFHEAFGTEIVGANLTSDVTLAETILKVGPTEDGPTFTYSEDIPGSGAINTSLAPNTAYLINKETSAGGRRGKGRMFLPGVFDGAVDDSGNVAGATVTQINDALDAYHAVILLAVEEVVVLHAPTYTWAIVGGQPRRVYSDDAPPAPTHVNRFRCAAAVATQRNRLRR